MVLLQASETAWSFLGVKLFEAQDFVEILVRFCYNMLMLFLLIRMLYYRYTKRRDYMFTFFMIGIIVFLLCYLLENVKLQIGMALGLFAIFGILRFRTIQISIKEMTYLFVVIGVSVINALANKKVSYVDLVFANALIIGITWIAELVLFKKPLKSQQIMYDNIELIKPAKRKELLEDLSQRTGLKIRSIEIGKLSFLRDTVRINIYYFDKDQDYPK